MTILYGWIVTAVSFLLVFRLNRAGSRYWLGRQFWGQYIALGRNMTSCILVHGGHDPGMQNEALRWLLVTIVVTVTYIRGDKNVLVKKNRTAPEPRCGKIPTKTRR